MSLNRRESKNLHEQRHYADDHYSKLDFHPGETPVKAGDLYRSLAGLVLGRTSGPKSVIGLGQHQSHDAGCLI